MNKAWGFLTMISKVRKILLHCIWEKNKNVHMHAQRQKVGLSHALLLPADEVLTSLCPLQNATVIQKSHKKSELTFWSYFTSPLALWALTWCSFVRHRSGRHRRCSLHNRAWCHLQTLPLPLQLLFSFLGCSDLFFYHR